MLQSHYDGGTSPWRLVLLTNAEEVREVLSELFSVGQGAVGLNQHQALLVKIKNLVRKHI